MIGDRKGLLEDLEGDIYSTKYETPHIYRTGRKEDRIK